MCDIIFVYLLCYCTLSDCNCRTVLLILQIFENFSVPSSIVNHSVIDITSGNHLAEVTILIVYYCLPLVQPPAS